MPRLLTDSFPDDAALDTAVSRALMQRVAAGELPETLRIAQGPTAVAFGKRDVVTPGYEEAVRAAREGGYEAVVRLAGGRAAVFHEDTIVFGHAVADPDPRSRIGQRFEEAAALIASALRRLGVDARVGEVPGEYCPGAHSVNAGGRLKLVGIGQRLVSGAAHVGGVVVVRGSDRVREVLLPVYAALGLDWRPETTGSVADGVPGAQWREVAQGIADEYRRRHDLEPAALDPETLALARTLAPEHVAGAR